jgi:nudix-type nucleoside diphosphatase (YffH/AdpP family)
MTISDRVRVKHVEILSDDYYLLQKTTFEYRRANGEWQEQTRETYDRGNCATVLPYNLAQRTVILVRQFRYPAYVNGYDDLLIEAAAGVLDGDAPEVRIRAEAEEELGYRLGEIRKIFEAFSSPGTVTEKQHFFVAEYDPAMRVGSGGGLAEEGRHRGAGAADRPGASDDFRWPHRRCKNHHAAAIRGAAYFPVRTGTTTKPSW